MNDVNMFSEISMLTFLTQGVLDVFTHIRCLRLKAKAVAENMPLPCPEAVRRSKGSRCLVKVGEILFLGKPVKTG